MKSLWDAGKTPPASGGQQTRWGNFMGYSSKQEEEVELLLSSLNGKEEPEKNGSQRPTLAFQPKS